MSPRTVIIAGYIGLILFVGIVYFLWRWLE